MPVSTYENLLYKIGHRIRQSLALQDILDTAVQEIRAFLLIDRAKIYQFDRAGSGEVIAESVDRKRLPSLLHLHFPAGDIPQTDRERFIRERQRVIVDINLNLRGVSPHEAGRRQKPTYHPVDPCHVEYLQAMGVTASLVMPILHKGELWGLLVIHHSEPRHFSRRELGILELLSEQLEIAIAQSYLLAQAQQQAQQEIIINRINQLLHCPLDPAEIRQRVLETTIDSIDGQGGQLYIQSNSTHAHAELFSSGLIPCPDFYLREDWQSLLADSRSRLSIRYQTLRQGAEGWDDDYFVAEDIHDASSEIAPEVYTTEDLTPWPELQALFQEAGIKTMLLCGFWFQEECLGYLAIFRTSYTEEIRWAGYREEDGRQARPRISFEMWKEIRQDLTPTWTVENRRLMHAISLHLYMATLQQQLTDKLRYQAYHDSLTKLANRLMFTEQLGLELLQAEQTQEMLAIAFLDLDRFKNINDSLGHESGDRLLTIVAQRLKAVLRPHDTIARWGGDEFTLLLTNLLHSQEIVDLGHQILRVLAEPVQLGNHEIVVTASLGIAIAPYDGNTVETLLQKADAALYQAKHDGKNTFHFFCQEHNPSMHNLVLEVDLRKAIESEELILWYQPQIKISTGEVIGVEALARWPHPKLGMVAPDRFIALAENTGLIKPLGKWALKKACAQHQEWKNQGLPPLRISVNLSVLQLRDAKLLTTIQQTLEEYAMAPEFLEIEITETAAMQAVELTLNIMTQLQSWGVSIALDDFGMGYSSLNMIKQFPIQTLKIDKSFVQDALEDFSNAAIAKTIIALGKGLRLSVLAEGVETPQQLQFLNRIGCDYAQGYLFGRPTSPDELKRKLLEEAEVVNGKLYFPAWRSLADGLPPAPGWSLP